MSREMAHRACACARRVPSSTLRRRRNQSASVTRNERTVDSRGQTALHDNHVAKLRRRHQPVPDQAHDRAFHGSERCPAELVGHPARCGAANTRGCLVALGRVLGLAIRHRVDGWGIVLLLPAFGLAGQRSPR